MGEILPDGSIGGYQGYCHKCGEVITTNIQGNEIGEHICKRKAKYKIVRQSDGKVIKSMNLKAIVMYLDCEPSLVKLHIDKPVQLKGWEIKSV